MLVTEFMMTKLFLAYAYLTVLDDLVLVDYLAVIRVFRGCGVGTRLLTELKAILADKTIIIECENPLVATDKEDAKIKNRRIEFYKRSGFTLSNVKSKLFSQSIQTRIRFWDTDFTL